MPGGANRTVYVAVRITMLVVSSVFVALISTRILALIRVKWPEISTKGAQALFADAQLQVQTLMIICVLCEGVEYIDQIGIEGVWSDQVPYMLAGIRDLTMLTALARCMHVF